MGAYTWESLNRKSNNYIIIIINTLLRDTGLENVKDLDSCI